MLNNIRIETTIHSRFISSMWRSERQLVNQGNHHCSWSFQEESIKKAKGSILLNLSFNIIFIIWIYCYLLSKLVKAMVEETNNKNSAEKPNTPKYPIKPSTTRIVSRTLYARHWWKSLNYQLFQYSWEI